MCKAPSVHWNVILRLNGYLNPRKSMVVKMGSGLPRERRVGLKQCPSQPGAVIPHWHINTLELPVQVITKSIQLS